VRQIHVHEEITKEICISDEFSEKEEKRSDDPRSERTNVSCIRECLYTQCDSMLIIYTNIKPALFVILYNRVNYNANAYV